MGEFRRRLRGNTTPGGDDLWCSPLAVVGRSLNEPHLSQAKGTRRQPCSSTTLAVRVNRVFCYCWIDCATTPLPVASVNHEACANDRIEGLTC